MPYPVIFTFYHKCRTVTLSFTFKLTFCVNVLVITLGYCLLCLSFLWTLEGLISPDTRLQQNFNDYNRGCNLPHYVLPASHLPSRYTVFCSLPQAHFRDELQAHLSEGVRCNPRDHFGVRLHQERQCCVSVCGSTEYTEICVYVLRVCVTVH